MNAGERARYLGEVLALDPARDATAICALRARALGLAEGDAVDVPDHAEFAARRGRDVAQLHSLKEQLLSLSGPDLARALLAARSTDEPDLREWAERLERAAAVRGELRAMLGDRKLGQKIASGLVELAIASPGEAARLGLRRRDRISTPQAARTVRIVRKRYPGVAELIAGEMQKLAALKRERKLSKPAAAAGSFITLWLLISFIRVIVKLWNGGGD